MVEVTGFEPATSSSRTKRATKLRHTSKKQPRGESGPMAAELGFEPRHTESESAVLPLHNSALHSCYYTQKNKSVKCFSRFFYDDFEKSHRFKSCHPDRAKQAYRNSYTSMLAQRNAIRFLRQYHKRNTLDFVYLINHFFAFVCLFR